MSHGQLPDATRSSGDPGDDTASRFTYQWTYAAILTCMLLDTTMDVIEVFCEHHEDILLKHGDATFTGVQVKTRNHGADPWKATDPVVVSACRRFIQLEMAYPGRFRRFILASNHAFMTGKTTGTCLPHLIALAKCATNVQTAPPLLRTYLVKVVSGTACHPDVALSALQKVALDHDLPKLHHVAQALRDTLWPVWSKSQVVTHRELRDAAQDLMQECCKASSLGHRQVLPAYLAAAPDPAAVELAACLDGKRFDVARVDGILARATSTPSLLAALQPAGSLAAAGTPAVLEQKLEAGGFSIVSVNSAQDLRTKADVQALTWAAQVGEGEAIRRRDHIRSIVLHDCAEAEEATKATGEPYGPAMRTSLREHLKSRLNDGTPLFDSLIEHLEGHAYALTSECKVWWSSPFTIEEEA